MTCKASADEVPEPPDSGWAWVVLGASFVLYFLVVGFLASVSVYVHVWIEFFDGSAAETSLIVSMCSFMVGLLSPVAASICTRFGPRMAAMVGGVLMSGGLLVSAVWSTSTIFLIISLGLFTPLGMSLCINVVFVALGKYFKKRLARVMGVALAGASVGQLAFPPLYQYLIDQYGWRGSLMIVAALTTHMVAAGALIRPLTTKRRKSSKKRPKNRDVKLVANNTAEGHEDTNKLFEPNTHSLQFLNPSIFGKDNFIFSQTDTTLGVGSIFEGAADVSMTAEVTEEEDRIEYVDPDSLSSCSVSERDIPVLSNSVWAPFAVTTTENHQVTEHRGSFISGRSNAASMISQPLVKQSSALRLCRNPRFLILLPVAMAHGFGWASTTYHLVSRAESVNIEPESAALLLTIMGGGSLVGRLLIGWIVDKGCIRPELYYTMFLSVCALATIITPLVREFEPLLVVACVHGLSIGAASVVLMMAPRLVVKPSFVTSATAYLLLSWGVGEISGGALAGWFYDALDSYDYSFYLAGSVMIMGSALMFVIYCLQRAKQQRHGDGAKTQNGKGDSSVESGLNQFDLELTGPSVKDWGKVNPIFFMRERFETESDQSMNERMDEPVLGCHGIQSADFESETDKEKHGNIKGEEENSLGVAGQIAGEYFEKECGIADESLETENHTYDKVLVGKAYSLEFAHGNYTDVEVYERGSLEDVEETLKMATDTRPTFQDNKTVGVFETMSGEGLEMGFENPSYDRYDTSDSDGHESDSLEHSKNENESGIRYCGEMPKETVSVVVSGDGSDPDDYGIENPVYFARSNVTDYFTCDPKSVRGECDCADGAINRSEREVIAEENESKVLNPGYFGLSQITKFSMVNQKPGRDCEKPDEHNLKGNSECGSANDYELGMTNPGHFASSKISENLNDNQMLARDSYQKHKIDNLNTDNKGGGTHGMGLITNCTENQPDHDVEETFL